MIKHLFKHIKLWFWPKKTEIEYVEAALARYKLQLAAMDDDFNPADDCCPWCKNYPVYSDLYDKIERVEAWLVILKKRKENGLVKKRDKQIVSSKRN